MKYFLHTICILTLFALSPVFVFAATKHVLLENVPTSVAQQQQFYVDIALDPGGVSINGVQARVSFSEQTLSFVRAETGASSVTLWINQPHIADNVISFSGIIPGGFDGLINPFDPAHKKPGEIVRLVFVGKSAGPATIAISDVSITNNDGQGTLESLPDSMKTFSVSTNVAPSTYTVADTIPPTLTAQIVSEKDLFNGQYTLLFSASDKESGVDHVELKEGDSPWTTIESPYLLHNQKRSDILLLRAYDVAGNMTTISIAPIKPVVVPTVMIVIGILCVLILIYAIYKKSRQYKKIHTP
jgi:hypothetical protein